MTQELKKQAQATVTKPETQMAFPSEMPQKLEGVEKLLSAYQLKIEQVAPKKGLQASRIVAMSAAAIWMNPALLKCDPKSVLIAVMQLAMNGINPSKQFKEAYLIPYGKECQMQLGYLGIIKLAEKSAMIKAIWAEAVYEGDEFEEIKGTSPSIYHKSGPNSGDPKKVTHSYAVVEKMSGSKQHVVLNKVRIERLRMKSPMQKSGINGAWATDYDEMAKAKALKQVLKTIPLEDEYRSAIFLDEAIASSAQFDSMDGRTDFVPDYPTEGSAEVVTEPAKEPTDAERQAELDAQLSKENGGGAGPLFQG